MTEEYTTADILEYFLHMQLCNLSVCYGNGSPLKEKEHQTPLTIGLAVVTFLFHVYICSWIN